MRSLSFVAVLLGASVCFGQVKRPDGKGIGTIQNHVVHNRSELQSPASASVDFWQCLISGICWWGGPVMGGTTHVYYIWYGNWGTSSTIPILSHLAANIGGSPYFAINTTYKGVLNAVAFEGDFFDSEWLGRNLTDADIERIVARNGANDPHGVYFVLTSKDVNETSGFCTSYCGWHTHGSINGRDIKYAFVGSPARCPQACEAQTSSPNGNASGDAMASIVAHELEESVTDPDLNAWYSLFGEENADLCAWTYGHTYTVWNGSQANMHLGGWNYLIQQNWVYSPNGGRCALSLK